MQHFTDFTRHDLRPGRPIFTGRLPDELCPDEARFSALWALHPLERPELVFGDQRRRAPRWFAAYGADYLFNAATVRSAPVPELLAPYLAWARATIDPRLNGLLVNWYDAEGEHRIAPHRDAPTGRIPGCPIVTVSLGAERQFQMHVSRRVVPFVVGQGAVIVIPDETNAHHAHSVPHRETDTGRRISITIRGFEVDDG